MAFAEYRRWPEFEAIQQKCLVYAGALAHYAQDLCQPLHLTIDYDGRVKEDGSSPHAGIDEKVDSIVERLGLQPGDLAAAVEPVHVDSLMPAIMAEFDRGYSRLDALYELEEVHGSEESAEARGFAEERAAAVRFRPRCISQRGRCRARFAFPDGYSASLSNSR